jgi:uncharacterized protein (TIGR02466 family)
MDQQIASAFPTPVGRFTLPDAAAFNAGLRRVILDRERAETGGSAVAWRSGPDLLEWPGPEVGTLRGWMMEAVNRMVAATAERRPYCGVMTAYAWAVVARKGHFQRVHNHPGGAWSGTYWVDAGDGTGGELELCDPRPFTDMVATPGNVFGPRLVVRPETGLMLVVPGWLYRFTNPYDGGGPRVSVGITVPFADASARPLPNVR